MLTFLVGSKPAFEVSLADVSQTQLQGKNEVVLEFHVDDTTGANEVSIAYSTCQPASFPQICFSCVGGFQLVVTVNLELSHQGICIASSFGSTHILPAT